MTVDQLREWTEGEFRSMRNRIWAIALCLFIPTLSGGFWLYATAQASQKHIEEAGPRIVEHDRMVQDSKTVKRQLNWVGQALERMAREKGVVLPDRPLVPED